MLLDENLIFWKNLEKIRDILLFDEQEFANFLGIKYSMYLKTKLTNSFLPLNCVFELAEKMNFHFEDLLCLNFKPRYSHVQTSREMILSERYSIAMYSEIQPILNIINYLELVRGIRAKTNLIRKFQLTDDFFEKKGQKTNILLITDIVRYLKQTYQFTDAEFLAMGQRTPYAMKGSFLREKLMSQKNVEGIVSYFVEGCSHLFDKNYNYHISSIVQNNAVIEATPKKNVLDELSLKKHELSNEQACLTRMGVISSITLYKYGKNAPITKIASIFSGDESNRYLLDLAPFQNIDLSRNFSNNVISIYH